jgi:hypothetical protein
LVDEKVWEIENLTFGFGVWLFIIMLVLIGHESNQTNTPKQRNTIKSLLPLAFWFFFGLYNNIVANPNKKYKIKKIKN